MKRDFDKFISERRKNKPNSFTMFGTEYHLPPTIPYEAVLQFNALTSEDKDTEVGNDKILMLLDSLIGRSNIDLLKAHVEFDMDLAIELLNYLLDVYGLRGNASPNQTAVTDQVQA